MRVQYSSLQDLPTPALIVDATKLYANVAGMQQRAARLGVSLRPHIKTHKCVEIARLQLDSGARGVTVSTLFEAETMAAAGIDDITWAFPLILSRLPEVAALAERVRLGVVVDSEIAARALAESGAACGVWIKVDCGYHRAGISWRSEAIDALAALVVDLGLPLRGFLSHSGNAYDVQGDAARAAIAEEERARVLEAAQRCRAAGTSVAELSVGSTPAMTAARDLTGVDEARPGNYAFFDATQVALGSCAVADCAATVLASVVSLADEHAVLDAGALALSKDPGTGVSFGATYRDYEAGALAPERCVTSLSQEHGKLAEPNGLKVGDRIRILPNHSCLTVACFPYLFLVEGERVLERWLVHNGR